MILHIYLNLGSFKRVHVSKFTSMQLHISSKFSTAVGELPRDFWSGDPNLGFDPQPKL